MRVYTLCACVFISIKVIRNIQSQNATGVLLQSHEPSFRYPSPFISISQITSDWMASKEYTLCMKIVIEADCE